MASRLGIVVAALLFAVSCFPETQDLVGKSCNIAADCPQPLSCVVLPSSGTRSCQSSPLPEVLVAAPTVFFCTDVKPILDQYCNSCHSSPPNDGAPSSSRFDVYEDTTVGGNTVAGAFSKATQIKALAADTDIMPPSPLPKPTDAERKVIADWVRAGAPQCKTGTDGGTVDAGG